MKIKIADIEYIIFTNKIFVCNEEKLKTILNLERL